METLRKNNIFNNNNDLRKIGNMSIRYPFSVVGSKSSGIFRESGPDSQRRIIGKAEACKICKLTVHRVHMYIKTEYVS